MTDRLPLAQHTDVLPADRLRNLIDHACHHLTPQEANALRGAAAGTMRNATAAVAELHQRLARAEAERDQHAAQLTAARELHQPGKDWSWKTFGCTHDGAHEARCIECGRCHPCPTIRALDTTEGSAR